MQWISLTTTPTRPRLPMLCIDITKSNVFHFAHPCTETATSLSQQVYCTSPLHQSTCVVAMFISVQPPCAMEDYMRFANLFEAIKAGRFQVISMSRELKKLKLTKKFVDVCWDKMMAASSSQMLRVCLQFQILGWLAAGRFWRSIHYLSKCVFNHGCFPKTSSTRGRQWFTIVV